jgi:Zn-dependent peptidase ImmA (M78 family)
MTPERLKMTQKPDWYRTPSQVLSDLGIQEPSDIDIEAIAEDCGATIQYRRLSGCAARIMGFNDRAIITIDEDSPRPRQRFSAGHELGHWMRDRGQAAFQCQDRVFVKEWSAENPETRANRYAGDLLLPAKMFRLNAGERPITFDTTKDLAKLFCTSLTATAIRLVEYGAFPSILVCNSPQKRDWYICSSEVRGKIWLEERPGAGSLAYSLLHSQVKFRPAREVGSDAWFNHRNARNYRIYEDSQLIADGVVLSLLWWKDETQLIDIDREIEERGSWRSDFRGED